MAEANRTTTHAGELNSVLITGGTDGLGRATALLLAEEGYRVFATGRDAGRRAALSAEASKRDLPLETLEMDVCDDASVDRAVSEIERKAHGVDILVNNAGIAIVAVMEEISIDDLRRQFETNFFAVVRVTQRVLPGMRERRRGRIINISSVSGRISVPLMGPYSSSKFALEAISDALRLELVPFGIPVVLIEPGYIPSGMQSASIGLSARYAKKSRESPYAVIYHSFRRNWKTRESHKPRYTPEDCARVVLRVVRDNPPKPRYTVTRNAWIGNLMRRLVPDRALDRWVRRRYGIPAPPT